VRVVERAERTATRADDSGFQAWHLFVIGGLLAATAAALFAHGTRPANVVFLSLAAGAAAWCGYALHVALAPLVGEQADAGPEVVGGRTRAALERDKTLVLRAIKELEFDRAMGKVSEADCQEMTARLRARAMRLIAQLDEGAAGYRLVIEQELQARGGARPGGGAPSAAAALEPGGGAEAPPREESGSPNECARCGSANDADAQFCKRCGTRLAVSV
jgi:hypothetical protein